MKSMSDAHSQLLRAGAVLLEDDPTGDPLGGVNARAVAQEVRTYGHRLLGSRVVARLTATNVALASDATMEFLGFNAPVSSGTIGVALHSALGFPESALIADPKNARYALGVVKDLNRLARAARNRAGAAKESMEALAETLGKSVPQFLPGYFEQCGRIFVANENVTYAGAMFVKARTAEATYGLVVDEEQRRAAFLEFAFAGALPAKALDDYAKSLAAAYPPQRAYAHFYSLALQRTRGGLAPWAQLMDVVKRMAKAASIDPEPAQREMLTELFGSPSLRFASLTFWKSIRGVVVSMAADPVNGAAIRGALLNLHPSGGFVTWWMELLRECGALRALSEPDANVVEAERAIGSRGAWLNRFVGDVGSESALLSEMLRSMAPQLVAEDALIQLHSWRVPVDCIDLALELGIRCAPPTYGWYSYAFDEKGERPLHHLARAPHLRSIVERAVRNAIRAGSTKTVFSREGLHPFLIEWIEESVEAICPASDALGKGAFDFTEAVKTLVGSATPEMIELVASARDRLMSADIVGAFERQLHAGLFEEYTWPAFEAALSGLESGLSKKSEKVVVEESWPYAILRDDRRAIVVDHNGVVLEHDLRWKADTWQKRLLFIDGVLFVSWGDWSSASSGYWTNNAGNVFTSESMEFSYYSTTNPSLPVAGGGRTTGGRVIKLGDTASTDSKHILCDGVNYWVREVEHHGDGWRLACHEFDPQTGTRGRRSHPTFVEQHLSESTTPKEMELLPALPGTESSPFGSAGGLLGTLQLDPVTSDGNYVEGVPYTLIRIDGVQTQIDVASRCGPPVRVMDWVGTKARYLVTAEGAICTPTNFTRVCSEPNWFGHSVALPLMYWHHLTVRDSTGSNALRACSTSQSAAIVAKAQELVGAAVPSAPFQSDGEQPELDEVVRSHLAISAPKLVSAVSEAAAVLALAKGELDAWLSGVSLGQGGSGFAAVDESIEQRLTAGAVAITHASYSMALLTQLRTLKFFVGLTPGTAFGELDYSVKYSLLSNGATPASLMDGSPALVYRLLLQSTPAEQRDAIVEYLTEWLDHPISQHDSLTFGKYRIECEDDPEGQLLWGTDGTPWWIHRSEMDPDNDDNDDLYEVNAVAFRADATPPPGYVEVKTWSVEPYVKTERVREILELVRSRGALPPMSADAATAFASRTGVSRSEAAVVLSGFCGVGYQSIDFTKEMRDTFAVKATEVKAAANSIGELSLTKRQVALISACYGENAERFWDEPVEVFAGALAEGWAASFGSQTPIPDELLSTLTKLLSDSYRMPSPRELLSDLDGSVPMYDEDVPIEFDANGDISSTGTMGDNWIEGSIRLLTMLAHDLPVGDPWRWFIPKGLASLRRKLNHESLLLPWSAVESSNTMLHDLVANLSRVEVSAKLQREIRVYDAGDMVVVNGDDWNEKPVVWRFHLRPTRFDSSSPTRTIADSFLGHSHALPTLLSWLFSDRPLGFLKRVHESPVANGSYEQNPLLSAPDLVDRVAKELEIDTNSAAYYLQLLVLAEPTTANIRRWNGWSAKELKAASDPLIAKGLIVAAKRAGAGRDLFLPGGWVEMRAPAMNIEEWKTPFYALSNSPSAKRASFLGRVLPLDAIHTLFDQAWERWMNGDRPGFVAVGAGLGQRKKGKS